MISSVIPMVRLSVHSLMYTEPLSDCHRCMFRHLVPFCQYMSPSIPCIALKVHKRTEIPYPPAQCVNIAVSQVSLLTVGGVLMLPILSFAWHAFWMPGRSIRIELYRIASPLNPVQAKFYIFVCCHMLFPEQ